MHPQNKEATRRSPRPSHKCAFNRFLRELNHVIQQDQRRTANWWLFYQLGEAVDEDLFYD